MVPPELTAEARALLRSHDWPGNVRQVQYLLKHALPLNGEGELSAELLVRLLQVVQIKVCIAKRVDEFTRLQTHHVGHHVSKQRIRRDVERHTQEDVRRTLVELARKTALGDPELKETVAWRQRHRLDVSDIPSTHDVAT